MARYERALAAAEGVTSLEARALVMLGGAALLQAREHARTRAVVADHASVLAALVARERRPDHAWFRIVLGDAMYRLPEALIRAGLALGRASWLADGLDTLAWLMAQDGADAATPALDDACAAAAEATGAADRRPAPRIPLLPSKSHRRYLAAA